MSQHAAEKIALLWNALLIADEAPPCLCLKLICPPKKQRLILYFFKKRKKEGARRGDRAEVTTSQASATVWECNSPLTFNLHTKKLENSRKLELRPRRHEVVCHSAGSLSCGILQQYKKNCIVLMISFCFLLRFCFTLEDVNYHCDDHNV